MTEPAVARVPANIVLTPTNPLGCRPYIYTIVTPDIDASIHYYCKLMEYELLGRGQLPAPLPKIPGVGAAGRRCAFIRTMPVGVDAGVLRLLEAPPGAMANRPRPGTNIMDPGLAVIECLSRNVDESWERLTAAGVQTITRPQYYQFGDMPALNGSKPEHGLEFRSYCAFGPAGEQMFISTCVTRDHQVPPPWPIRGLHNGFVAGVLISLDRWPVWRFYDAALGIKPTRDTFSRECAPLIGAAPGAHFQFGMMGEPTMMEWWEFRHRQPEPAPPFPTSLDQTGLAMTTMVVNSLDVVRERVRIAGIPVLAEGALPVPGRSSQDGIILRGGVGELVEVIGRDA
jgi:catechol 2,3-dioxygenase-like lactoylglutathione lyase family enzyme